MVSVPFKQEKYNLRIGLVMIAVAILFLLYMGWSMVHSTHDFWNSCSLDTLLK